MHMVIRQKLIGLFTLMIALVVGLVFSLNKLGAAPVYAQSMGAQSQALTNATGKEVPETITSEKGGVKEGVEATEPASEQVQEKNLPGGGHQDVGQADHQFEGVE